VAADARILRGFVRASVGASSVNPIDQYLDAGLSLSSPLLDRPNDKVGVAIAAARLSPYLRDLRANQAQSAGGAYNLPRFEAVTEVSWQFSLGPHVYIEPNVQIIFHPSAALLTGPLGNALPSHAWVIGLRTSLSLK